MLFINRFQWNCVHHKMSANKIVQMYRHIQLLAKIGNSITSEMIMMVIISAAILITSLSVVILVRLKWSMENILMIAMFGMYLADAMLMIIICLGGMAGVYIKSRVAIRTIKSNDYLSKYNAWEREILNRFCKSCRVMRIQFGGDNFIEDLTPLNCFCFSNSLTVQFLCLGM